jgi:hypothetical protein
MSKIYVLAGPARKSTLLSPHQISFVSNGRTFSPVRLAVFGAKALVVNERNPVPADRRPDPTRPRLPRAALNFVSLALVSGAADLEIRLGKASQRKAVEGRALLLFP